MPHQADADISIHCLGDFRQVKVSLLISI